MSELTINSFGQEKINYITNRDMDNIIDNVNSYEDACSTPSKLVRLIHFNEVHPENHNLKLKQNTDTAYIFDGDKWVITEKNKSINNLIDKSYNIIVSYYNRRKILYKKKNDIIKQRTVLLHKFPLFKKEILHKIRYIETLPIYVSPVILRNSQSEYDTTIFDLYYDNFLFDYFELFNRKVKLENLPYKNIEELKSSEVSIQKLIEKEAKLRTVAV
tara:strand:- start:6326 stop:6973 length:648 start_codon:yes stop_codon:yes gene_type:complete